MSFLEIVTPSPLSLRATLGCILCFIVRILSDASSENCVKDGDISEPIENYTYDHVTDKSCCDHALREQDHLLRLCANRANFENLAEEHYQKRLLVVSHATPGTIYAGMSAAINAMYLRDHGYPFVLDEWNGGTWANGKPSILGKWLEKCVDVEISWLVWVDSDVIFVAQDHPVDVLGDLLYRKGQDGVEILVTLDPHGRQGTSKVFNTGTLMLRCSSWTLKFVAEWKRRVDKESRADQEVFETMVLQQKLQEQGKVVALPPQSFNSRSEDMVSGPHAEDQPVIHLAGHSHTLRVNVFSVALEAHCSRPSGKKTNFTAIKTAFEENVIAKAAIEFNTSGVSKVFIRMAGIYEERGKLKEAESMFRYALEKNIRIVGPSAYETLVSTHNFGTFLMKQDRLGEAEPMYRYALEGNLQKLTALSSSTLVSAECLGLLLRRQKRYQESEAMYRMVLRAYTSKPIHPRVLERIHELNVEVQSEAKSKYGQIEQEVIAVSAESKGSFTASQDRKGTVEKKLRGLIHKAQKHLGEDHPFLASTRYNLGVVMSVQGRTGEAALLWRQALELQLKLLGPTSPETEETLAALSTFSEGFKVPPGTSFNDKMPIKKDGELLRLP